MKYNQSRPGFELVSPCSFPTTITITPRAPPGHITVCKMGWYAVEINQSITYTYTPLQAQWDTHWFMLPLFKTKLSKAYYLFVQTRIKCTMYANLGSSVSSTENSINMHLAKAWTALDRLSIISKSNLSSKGKRNFFQAVVVSILLYGCTTSTLTLCIEKK